MSQICSKMVIFLHVFSAYFDGHFCYHSNRKNRINTIKSVDPEGGQGVQTPPGKSQLFGFL